jgi:hypothetical protein
VPLLTYLIPLIPLPLPALLLLQVVPDALRYAGQSSGQYMVMAAPQPLHSACATQQHSGGGSMVLPSHASQQRSLPSYNAYYGSPAAQSELPAAAAALLPPCVCLLLPLPCSCPTFFLLLPDASKQLNPCARAPRNLCPLSTLSPALTSPLLPPPPSLAAARMARLASLERYRLKKARRGFGKKIRYQARKVNADKRPRVKVGRRSGRLLCAVGGWAVVGCVQGAFVGGYVLDGLGGWMGERMLCAGPSRFSLG